MPAWADAAVRSLLVAYIVVISLPIRYHAVAPGLDASWAFALNYFADKGLIHGRDVAFTYGPLGYLGFPMDIGANLWRGIAAQAALWLLYSGTIVWLAFCRRTPLLRLAIFAALLPAGLGTFHQFGYVGPDMFLAFWTLLLLGCALDGRSWSVFYGAAAAAAALLLFVKLSSGILALSALCGFAAAMLLLDRRRGLQAALIAGLGVPVSFAAIYLVYYPSFIGLTHYVRAGLEISSGYSAAMSEEGGLADLRVAAWIAASYLVLTGVLWWQRQRAFVLAAACLGPLFLEFKHSVVRYSGHSEIFFRFVPLVGAAVLLFTEFRRKSRWAVAAAAGLLGAAWYPCAGPYSAQVAAAFGRAHMLPRRQALAAQSQAALLADRLPPEVLARIAGRPAAFFPWESAYAAANALDYRPFPVFQTYQSYTAFLDRWNADFLAETARAPEFIVVDWWSIDERHPLLDVPAMSLAMYQWYDFDGVYSGHMLLKRRATPRFHGLRRVAARRLRRGEPLEYPAHPHPLIARIPLAPNLAGRLRHFFFRLPEVRAVFSSTDGSSFAARIPPDVAANGLPLNFTPVDFPGAQALFSNNQGTQMNAVALAGFGLDSFQPDAAVELFDIPEIRLAAPARADAGPPAEQLPEVDSAKIEVIGGRGVMDYSPREVIELRGTPGYVVVQGWAIDAMRSEPAGRVYIELDGKPCPAQYGIPHPAIAAAMGGQQYGTAGFQWVAPEWKLGATVHELRLKFVSRDGQRWCASRQRLRFRVSKAR